jgi:hypothetical protein
MKVWMSIERLGRARQRDPHAEATRPSTTASMPVRPGWRAASGAIAWPSRVDAVSCRACEAIRPSSEGSEPQPARASEPRTSQAAGGERTLQAHRPPLDTAMVSLKSARRSG